MNQTMPWICACAILALVVCPAPKLLAQPAGESEQTVEQASGSEEAPPADAVSQLPVDAAAQTVYLRIVNSRSGLGIAPKSLLIDGQPAEFETARQSLVALPVPTGSHTLEIVAEGFELMRVDVTVGDNPTPVMEVELDPTAPPPEITIDADKALLVGTVADADTAEPISGATLKIVGSTLSETTTGSGEFRFEVTTGDATDHSRRAVTLEVGAYDYGTLRMKNLVLDPGGRTRVPIKLNRDSMKTPDMEEVDASTNPGSKFANNWTFDVSLR